MAAYKMVILIGVLSFGGGSSAQDWILDEGSGQSELGSGETGLGIVHADKLRSQQCPSAMDLCLLLDASGSMRGSAFDSQIQWALKLVENLPISRESVRVCAVMFTGYAHTEFALNTYSTKQDVIDHLRNMNFRSGVTRTGNALRRAFSEMTKSTRGGRREAQKVIVLFTDGLSIDDPLEIALKLRQQDRFTIYTFAVAKVSFAQQNAYYPELRGISGSDDRMFDNDQIDSLQQRIIDDAEAARKCNERPIEKKDEAAEFNNLPIIRHPSASEVSEVGNKGQQNVSIFKEDFSSRNEDENLIGLPADGLNPIESALNAAELGTGARRGFEDHIGDSSKKLVIEDLGDSASNSAGIVDDRDGDLLIITSTGNSAGLFPADSEFDAASLETLISDENPPSSSSSISNASAPEEEGESDNFFEQESPETHQNSSSSTNNQSNHQSNNQSNSFVDNDRVFAALLTTEFPEVIRSNNLIIDPVRQEGRQNFGGNSEMDEISQGSIISENEGSQGSIISENEGSQGSIISKNEGSQGSQGSTSLSFSSGATTEDTTETTTATPSLVGNGNNNLSFGQEQEEEQEQMKDNNSTRINYREEENGEKEEEEEDWNNSTSPETTETSLRVADPNSPRSRHILIPISQIVNYRNSNGGGRRPLTVSLTDSTDRNENEDGKVGQQNPSASYPSASASMPSIGNRRTEIVPNAPAEAVLNNSGNDGESQTNPTGVADNSSDILDGHPPGTSILGFFAANTSATMEVQLTTIINHPPNMDGNVTSIITSEPDVPLPDDPFAASPTTTFSPAESKAELTMMNSSSQTEPNSTSQIPNLWTDVHSGEENEHSDNDSEPNSPTESEESLENRRFHQEINGNRLVAEQKLHQGSIEETRTTLPKTAATTYGTKTSVPSVRTLPPVHRSGGRSYEELPALEPIARQGSVQELHPISGKRILQSEYPSNVVQADSNFDFAPIHTVDDSEKRVFEQLVPPFALSSRSQTTFNRGCTADILVILDSSGSVQQEFHYQRDLIRQLVDAIDLDSGRHRMSLMQFAGSRYQKFNFGFQEALSKEAIVDEILRLRPITGTTYMKAALKGAQNQLDSRSRVGSKTLVIIISDGFSQDDAVSVAEEIRSMPNTQLYTIALATPYHREYLEDLAGRRSNVFVGTAESAQFIRMVRSEAYCSL